MAQTKHTNPDVAPRPLTSEQEAQVGGGVLINHGPRTPEQRERDKADRQERQDAWQGIKTWFGNLF